MYPDSLLTDTTTFDRERNSTDADLARDAVDDLRRAEAMFAAAWRIARDAIMTIQRAGYDWRGDEASDAYGAMQYADDACAQYAAEVEANIVSGGL